MKFSIRDLLLVTVIVALAIGWFIDRRQQATQIEHAERRFAVLRQLVERDGKKVFWSQNTKGEIQMGINHTP